MTTFSWRKCSPLVLGIVAGGPAWALEDIAERCESALSSGDRAAFEAVVDAIRPRKDVFDIDARKRVEACLSQGFGEPWEYSFPDRAWLSVAEAQGRLADREAAEDAAAQKEAESAAEAARQERMREENAQRVAELVYTSCVVLLDRDEIAAMTNQVCVESFLANGLPQP